MLLVPIGLVFLVGAFVVLKQTVWNNADVVVDAGDHLIAERSGTKAEIPLAEIVAVKSNRWGNPEQITVTLEHCGPLGAEVSFMLPGRSWRFTSHPIARELAARTAKTRANNSPEATPGQRSPTQPSPSSGTPQL